MVVLISCFSALSFWNRSSHAFTVLFFGSFVLGLVPRLVYFPFFIAELMLVIAFPSIANYYNSHKPARNKPIELENVSLNQISKPQESDVFRIKLFVLSCYSFLVLLVVYFVFTLAAMDSDLYYPSYWVLLFIGFFYGILPFYKKYIGAIGLLLGLIYFFIISLFAMAVVFPLKANDTILYINLVGIYLGLYFLLLFRTLRMKSV